MNIEIMEARTLEIQEELAGTLPRNYLVDVTLESVGEKGDVRLTLRHARDTKQKFESAEILIGINDDLSFIQDTFGYSNTFSPRSKMIALQGLKQTYFDEYGYLNVIRTDTTEVFKVSTEHRQDVEKRLRLSLGHKFNAPTPENQVKPKETSYSFKVEFEKDNKRDYFIVSSSTMESTRTLAYELLNRWGLDIKENNVTATQIDL